MMKSIFLQIIRSLNSDFKELGALINNLPQTPLATALIELWCKNESNVMCIYIPNYHNPVMANRKTTLVEKKYTSKYQKKN